MASGQWASVEWAGDQWSGAVRRGAIHRGESLRYNPWQIDGVFGAGFALEDGTLSSWMALSQPHCSR